VGGNARAEVSFTSGGLRCAAWLYRPPGPGPQALVVLAHGFAFPRDARLDAYAERFVAAGLAALVFDYRHFGASAGHPRQLMDIDRQLGDWRAAIAYARSLPGIDPDRIALWGTSFSGGHVAALAAADPRIAAAISQVPYSGLGGRGRLPRPVFLARMIAAAVRDKVRGRSGRCTGQPRSPDGAAPISGGPFRGLPRGSGSSARSLYRPSSCVDTCSPIADRTQSEARVD
jgi:alpha-beta hydrolase superfamily lysophospholipase